MNKYLAIIKDAINLLSMAIALVIMSYFMTLAGMLGALAAIDMVGFADMMILIDTKQ